MISFGETIYLCTSITRIAFLSLCFKLGIFQYILQHEKCGSNETIMGKALKYLCSVRCNECVFVLITAAALSNAKRAAHNPQQPFMFNYYCNLVEIHTAQSIGTHMHLPNKKHSPIFYNRLIAIYTWNTSKRPQNGKKRLENLNRICQTVPNVFTYFL